MKKKILLVFIILLLSTILSCSGEFTNMHYLSLDQVSVALKETDQSFSNQDHVFLIYSRTESNKSNHCNNPGCWNIEHIYPKSLLPNLDSHHLNDLHNLRASDWQLNTDKGNLPIGPAPKGSPAGVYNGKWYPGDQDRGDVARILMYMANHYEGLGVKLETMIDPDLALRWHREDPVDAFERARNAAIKEIQGNNNPFITNPSYARQIYGSNLFLIWIIGIVISIALALLIRYVDYIQNKNRYYTIILTIAIIFSSICGFIWRWWVMLLIFAAVIGLGIYGSKRGEQQKSKT